MLALLSLLTFPAFAGPSDRTPEEVVDQVAERLGLTAEIAEDLEMLVVEHRSAMADHRQAVKEAAATLRTARERGDVKAMKRQLQELRRLEDQSRSLKDRHYDDVTKLLTIDQQAQWVLHSLRRKTKRRTTGLPEAPR